MSYEYAIIDIETTGLVRFRDKITWIGVGLAKDIDSPIERRFLFDMRGGKELERFKRTMSKIRKQKISTVTQNGKFDVLFIEHHTGEVVPIHFDTMLLGTAYDMGGEHGLEPMAIKYLNSKPWKIPKKVLLQGKAADVKPYLTDDLEKTWGLCQYFVKNMRTHQWKHYYKLLRPAYLMFRNVERNGVYISQKQYRLCKNKYTKIMEEKLAELNKHYEINWNSSDQLQHVLFDADCEGLPIVQKSAKTGKPSTNAHVLKTLALDGHELPKKILEYRDAKTLVVMFLNRWGNDASFDGRIHPQFGMTNVRTGRTSCSEPNLQQVPRNGEVRCIFRAPPPRLTGGKHKVFFEADYSQLELRIAADYSNDRTMIKIYREGGDIHTNTARIVTNRETPTKDDRTKAKPVNFGFLYGQQAKGFVNYAFDNYGVTFSLSESRRIRDGFFAMYSSLEPWHREMEQRCEYEGGVYNRFGRFRALPDIYSQDWGKRSGAQRRAINTPVQSTGSDLLLGAVAELDRTHRKNGIIVCGTIHDSIVGECWEEDQDWVQDEIRRIMTHPRILDVFDVGFRVPIEVDIGFGPWGAK